MEALTMAIATMSKKVQRGDKSWSYIYRALGATIALEGASIQIAQPPYGLLLFLVVTAGLTWLFLRNAWVQNKVVGVTSKIETTWRG